MPRPNWDDPIPFRPTAKLPSVKGEDVECTVTVAGYRVRLTIGNELYLLTDLEAAKLAYDLAKSAQRLGRMVADTETES